MIGRAAPAGSGGPHPRLDGWGFEGVEVPPPAALVHWLVERLGPGTPATRLSPRLAGLPRPRKLPRLPVAASAEPFDRLAHARGQGLPDLLWRRAGVAPALPDGVVRPREGEVASTLAACAGAGLRVVIRGGGTSVTGGVNVQAGEGRRCRSISNGSPAWARSTRSRGSPPSAPAPAGQRLEAALGRTASPSATCRSLGSSRRSAAGWSPARRDRSRSASAASTTWSPASSWRRRAAGCRCPRSRRRRPGPTCGSSCSAARGAWAW